MKNIEDEADVKLLVDSFYSKILNDPLLQPIFKMAMSHWDQHLETMYSFWNNILFYDGGYYGNPLKTHKEIHRLQTLSKPHFDRWLQLFNQTLDELFTGEKAALAKQRAYAIATVMQVKILPPIDTGSELIY
ncbi:MAG: group III truncated hemoglobin [Chitinophagaceae bacterium]